MDKLPSFLRSTVLKILNEQAQAETGGAEETTTGAGRGGWKKSIRETGALAKTNPAELMKRLKISSVNQSDDIKRLFALLKQAAAGHGAMKNVYGVPTPRKHAKSGKQGIRLPVSIITPRDGMKWIEHTLHGAQNAGIVRFNQEIQVEILGSDVLAYFSSKPRTWDAVAKTKKKKPAKAQPAQPAPTEDKK